MSNHLITKITKTLILLLVIASSKARAQCTVAPYKNGSTFTTENTGSLDFNFSNTSNVSSADGSYSTAGSLLTLLNGNTYYLKATNFGYTIPSYGMICGIRVQIVKRANGLGLWGEITDYQVRIVKGGLITGTNKASGAAWDDDVHTTTYGGTADLWGTTLTPDDVNAGNFGVAISAHIAGVLVAPDAQIDNIRLSVIYSLVLPVTLSYFTINKTNNKTTLEWQTTEEEDNAYISLQRSLNNDNNWQEIKKYELSIHNHNKIYKYEDATTGKGKYSYRLKMVSGAGAITYSAIKTITVSDENRIAVYPNPASNFIILEGAVTEKEIVITDIFTRKWILPVIKTTAAAAQVNIKSLPKGIYFLNTGSQSGKFLKE